MEIQQLRYVIALAHERHFQRAAERVHITQPTLSQQIQKLEKELGAPLFERSNRQVRLTEAGERFLPHATNVLATLEKAQTDIKGTVGRPAGRVILGAIPTIGPYILPDVVKRLRRKAPDISIEIHDLTTSLLLQHMREGRIHIGLLSLPIDDRGLATRLIGKEPFYLAVERHHPLAHKRRISVSDLSDKKLLILQEGHCFRNQSLDYCKRVADGTDVVFQGSSLSSVMRMAAAGEGVTFVPKMAASKREHPDLNFLKFQNPEPTRDVGLVWRLTTPLSSAQNFLIDVIDEILTGKLR